MPSVSQNPDQKTSPKRHKIHRTHPEVSYKVIAFETILSEKQAKSEREINRLLNIPNSTMQTWRREGLAGKAIEDEVALFFASPAGAMLLHRIVLSIMYNNKCGASGICGVQECLRNSGLNKYVASSTGALQEFWQRCEEAILTFGKNWEQKLAQNMKQKRITVILDEMFRKRQPCLVAIEAVSNYILVEKFTEDRTAATWKKELEAATKEIPVTIDQIVSDLCGAIRCTANLLEAEHSPDLFHGLYEISKATAGALSSQERAAEKSFNEAEEHYKKTMGKPNKIGIEEKKKQIQDREEAKRTRDVLQTKYEEKKKRREKTQEAKRALGKCYHPIDLETGQMQSLEIVAKKFEEQFSIIDKSVKEAGLAESSRDRIEKAKRAFALMLNFLQRFFIVFLAIVKNLQLNEEQEKFFKDVIFPLCYLKMIWRRQSKKEKEKITPLLKSLQHKLKEAAWREEYKEALMRRGKELAEMFQRSSSCVEGRNGVLSLLMHRFHHLSDRTMKVLTIVHNFGVKRKDDRTTAAERFFGGNHDELFSYLVDNVKIPGKPRLQIRKKCRWWKAV